MPSPNRFHGVPQMAKLTLGIGGKGYFSFPTAVNKLVIWASAATEVLVMPSDTTTPPANIPAGAASPITTFVAGESRPLTAAALPEVFEQTRPYKYWHIVSSAAADISASGGLDVVDKP